MLRKGLLGGLALFLVYACTSAPVIDKRADLLLLAEKGDAEAQYQMGKTYCCGYGGGYVTYRALSWFCKAALQGHGGAQYELGRFYGKRNDTSYRRSLRQDLIYAYMWYSLAELNAAPLAAAERSALATDMSEKEIREAGEHMRDWQTLACRTEKQSSDAPT